ncbi:MAG TPA: hypothetical protein DHV85_10045 [Candidatus Accumulibacter sp.]|nr:hypothetical protein [Accumulibacter sp.]
MSSLIVADRKTDYLPPSVDKWLNDDHLARFMPVAAFNKRATSGRECSAPWNVRSPSLATSAIRPGVTATASRRHGPTVPLQCRPWLIA